MHALPPIRRPCLLSLCVASVSPPPALYILPPSAFLGPLKSFLLTPDGSLILPAQILEAYALAYADG